MTRKLMASSALLALLSAGAISVASAEDTATNPAVVEDAATTNVAAETTAKEKKLVPDTPTLATAFIGRSVYSSNDPESDNIGDVNDLIIAEDGSITDAVVGVGGFLGIGEKNVAVPFDELKVVERDGEIRLIYAATREELEAAPAIDMATYDPAVRYAEEQAALNLAQQPGGFDSPLAPAPSAGDNMAAAPAQDLTAAPADDMAAAPAEKSDQEMAATDTAPAADQAATPPASSGNVAFLTASADQVRASDLIGHEVYRADDEVIGAISDLVFQVDGGQHAALIDVGGFLGVGQKTVAVPFDKLNVSRADEAAQPKITVAMTKEQLEQLPALEAEAATMTEPAAGEPASDNMAAAEEPSPLPDEMAATSGGTPMDSDVTTTGSIAPSQDLAASALIGAQAYGPDDSSLGTIGDVVFDNGGAIDGVIINVGGFLGIGSKPVAVEFDSLQVHQDEYYTVTVTLDATREQLDQAPTYEITMK